MRNDNDRIIDVDDDPVSDSRPTEIPEISIERKDSKLPALYAGVDVSGRLHKGKQLMRIVIVSALFVAGIVAVILLTGKGVASDGHDRMQEAEAAADNISALSSPYESSAAGVTVQSDSILGVAMDMYPLGGLRASLEREFPDTADRSLVLFMRSADYHPDGRSLGPLVVRGEASADKTSAAREGYVAVSPSGKTVIGISEDDDVEDWARKHQGDFFRQMVLLNDGELPRDFVLRGKVERAAIASTVDGDLYYIVTRHKESMYDFADAMREYGFVNAIYITGGNSYSFYRDADGNSHANSATLDKIRKYESRPLPQPLLVFRRSLSSK